MKTIGTLAAAAALLVAASAANAQMREYNILDPLGVWSGERMSATDHNFPAGPPSKTIAGSHQGGMEWDYE